MEENITQKIKQGIEFPQVIDESLGILKQNLKESHPYFLHSLRTGLILKEMGADEKTIACGITHEVPPEKLPFEGEMVRVAKKADQLRVLFEYKQSAKPKPLKKWQKGFLNQQSENLRRMFFAVAQDIRPIFVTLAGRLDEMKNLASDYPKDQQLKRSITAIEVLAPLAYGIGMGEIKGQLEDAAFPYLYPKEYNWLITNVKAKYAQREEQAEKIKPQLEDILTKSNINFLDTHARAKHYFSLYQKLLRYDMDIAQIYDLVALRVIVQDITACYRALGAVHNVWKPLYGRIKDYISSPKPNGYRSLHTTVACPECGGFMEIQIKTPQMHREAEYGAVAHLSYKEKITPRAYKHQFYWMDQLRQWKEEIKDPQKISEHLQTELFKNQIFALTPRKEVINLPRGSTPVDFAYAVHSEIGEHCAGAKVNGKMASLKQGLRTGDTVEIITDKDKSPPSDWLRFVKTHKARAKIRSFLEKSQGISFAKPGKGQSLKEKVALIKKIIPHRKKEPHVLIGGTSGISVKFSQCCKPKPGDKIAGFITKGEGASLHKADCSHLKKLQQKWPQRIVQATWSNTP